MVDSRQKGARNELALKKKLIEITKLDFDRVPRSGAGRIKGDLYIPHCKNRYTIEVKAYKDDQITSNLLKNTKATIDKWWEQAKEEAKKNRNKPMLVFKKDRGQWIVGIEEELCNEYPRILYTTCKTNKIYLYSLETFLRYAEESIGYEKTFIEGVPSYDSLI